MPHSYAHLLARLETLQNQLQEERAWREAYAAENARLMAALLRAAAEYDALCRHVHALWAGTRAVKARSD